MDQRIGILADDDGAVVVKRATGSAVAALRAEGERLRAAAHPGVVQLLDSSGTDEAWELRLAHGGRPLEVVGSLTTEQIAGVVAALAATLADLHEAGIVHGRIDATHVLLGRHGRPVLCGLGRPGDAEPADDVAALGGLLAGLLGSSAEMEPIPERRWGRRRTWSGWDRRSLLLLADQACADPPTRRPTARRLAAAITDAVPDGLATSVAPAARTRLAALVAALATVLLVGGLGVRTLRPHGSQPERLRTEATSTTTTGGPRSSSSTPAPPRPAADLPPTTTTATPARVEGTRVSVGAHRYEVGQPGDQVVLGDWDCDGAPTPAVLRPATGEVFVFPSWASEAPLVVQPSARVAGATDLLAEPGTGDCPRLVARRGGELMPIPLEVGP